MDERCGRPREVRLLETTDARDTPVTAIQEITCWGTFQRLVYWELLEITDA